MKDKIHWSEKRPASKVVPREVIEKIEKELAPLGLAAGDIGEVSIENVDKILTRMESYYSQFGLVQICLSLYAFGEHRSADFYTVELDVEGEESLVYEGDGFFELNSLRVPNIYHSAQFDKNGDIYKETAAYGRRVYYALRKKHPLLTRSLGEPFGGNQREDLYEVVCEKCGMSRKYRRKCRITESPEHYRCSCGGTLVLKETV